MSPRFFILGLALVVTTVGAPQARALPGDLNCDTVVDGLDVGPFVLALIDPSGYGAAYPGCPLSNADFNCDGDADQEDVGGFVSCLLTGDYPPCGACCPTGGGCSLSLEADCLGTWQGAGSDCDPDPCAPPGMVPVGTGEFLMGNSFPGEGGPDELPRHAVYVDGFYMDIYEVTNQHYATALNWACAQGGLITVSGGVVCKYGSTSYPYCDTTTSNSHSRITWDGSTFGVVAGKESHPMVQVSWYGSAAYTNWRSAMQGKPLCYDWSTWECDFGSGYRLPTEAEWEKAARGGAEGRRFAWSDQDTIQHTRCNYYSMPSSYPYDTSPTSGYHPCWGNGYFPYTSPVDFFTGALQYKVDWGWPGSPTSYQTASGGNGYGLYDMAGNVWEWCNDWYSAMYYASSPYDNPHGPASGTYRVMRGGGWDHGADHSRVAYRCMYGNLGDRINGVGFRCVTGA
jgi:formylglycine-generating enzyme